MLTGNSAASRKEFNLVMEQQCTFNDEDLATTRRYSRVEEKVLLVRLAVRQRGTGNQSASGLDARLRPGQRPEDRGTLASQFRRFWCISRSLCAQQPLVYTYPN
jgi:hypothetical protein